MQRLVQFKATGAYSDWRSLNTSVVVDKKFIYYDPEIGSLVEADEFPEPNEAKNFTLNPRKIANESQITYLIPIQGLFHHEIHDTLPVVTKLHRLNPEANFIIFRARANPGVEEIYSYYEEFFEYKNIKHITLNAEVMNNDGGFDIQVFELANFINFPKSAIENDIQVSLQDCLDATNEVRDHIGAASIEPYRKVYMSGSREYLGRNQSFPLQPGFTGYTTAVRMEDEYKLEEYFSCNGYEVIVPEEKFNTFRDQLEYMASVKILASVTASSLSNMFFMKDEQKVIEIFSEFVGGNPIAQFLWTGWAFDAYIKKHLYIAVPSRRDPDEVIRMLELHKNIVNSDL